MRINEQLALPLDDDQSPLEPWDQRPDQWMRRPDVQFHGTTWGPQWPKVEGHGNRSGSVHLGTYAAAHERAADRAPQADDEAWILPRRVPTEDLDTELMHDPMEDKMSARDWSDWSSEFGPAVPIVTTDPEMDDDPWDIEDGQLSGNVQARRTREAAISAAGHGVRYVNKFEDQGSVSVEVPPTTPRTWAQDVLEQAQGGYGGAPHPNYVSAAERSSHGAGVEHWPASKGRPLHWPLPGVGRGPLGHLPDTPPPVRRNPLFDPEERPMKRGPRAERKATFDNEINIRY